MKQNDFGLLKEYLQESICDMQIDGKLTELRLISTIKNIFGATFTSHIGKIQVKNRTLYVEVKSSILKHNLMYQREAFVQKLNEEMGRRLVDEIVLL